MVQERLSASPQYLFALHGALAQLGEHLLCKQGVIGSIPIGSTKFGFASFGGAYRFLFGSIIKLIELVGSTNECCRIRSVPHLWLRQSCSGSVAQLVRARP